LYQSSEPSAKKRILSGIVNKQANYRRSFLQCLPNLFLKEQKNKLIIGQLLKSSRQAILGTARLADLHLVENMFIPATARH
jgi:hypothetical protein